MFEPIYVPINLVIKKTLSTTEGAGKETKNFIQWTERKEIILLKMLRFTDIS